MACPCPSAATRLTRQAGAGRSQPRAVSMERLPPAWRVTEMAKLPGSGLSVVGLATMSGRDKPCPYGMRWSKLFLRSRSPHRSKPHVFAPHSIQGEVDDLETLFSLWCAVHLWAGE
jgi:hypothetical protein